MGKNTIIYLITHCYENSNKVYIGKTINNSRKNDHKRRFGKNCEFHILEEIKGTNKDEWKERESYYIKYYYDIGFEVQNIQMKGGSGVEFHSMESINKIKKWREENKNHRSRIDLIPYIVDIINNYNDGEGVHILGRRYNCNPDVIKRILRENNIKFRTPSESQKCRIRNKKRPDLWDSKSEILKYFKKGYNYTKIGKLYNTSGVQIKNIINKCQDK